MSNSKISALIFIAMGIFIGVTMSTIFWRSTAPSSFTQTKIVLPSKIKKEVANSEVQYQKQIKQLEQSNSILKVQSNQAIQGLKVAKRKSIVLEQKLHQQISQATTLSYDDKDSLNRNIDDYTRIGNEKDSLCTEITTALSEQINNKDSTILVQNNQYDFLKSSLELSLAQQQTAIAQSNLYKKQMKRERTKKRFISAGLIVVGGLATYSLLQR